MPLNALAYPFGIRYAPILAITASLLHTTLMHNIVSPILGPCASVYVCSFVATRSQKSVSVEMLA